MLLLVLRPDSNITSKLVGVNGIPLLANVTMKNVNVYWIMHLLPVLSSSNNTCSVLNGYIAILHLQ